MSREELEALFEECRKEICAGKHCEAIEEKAKEKKWIDPVALALSTNVAHYLAGKTMEILALEIEEILKKEGIRSKTERREMVDSLHGYAWISHKEDLSPGRFIRWVTDIKIRGSESDPDPDPDPDPDLDLDKGIEKGIDGIEHFIRGITNGAFFIKYVPSKEGKGWNLLCKTWSNRFLKVAFEKGAVFQQLNREEIMVMLLSANI